MDNSAPEAQGVAARQLTQSLALDARQREALAPSFEQVEGRESGALWRLAAEMQKTLTTEQKERLLEQAQRPPREPGMRGMRGERGPRGGRPDSVAMQGRPGRGPRGGMRDSLATPGQRGNREAMGQAMRASMVEALALTPAQQEQLEALHTSQREAMKTLRDQHREAGASREAFEALRDAHRAALESIYTEEQREIIAIHRALAAGQATRGDRRGPRGPR